MWRICQQGAFAMCGFDQARCPVFALFSMRNTAAERISYALVPITKSQQGNVRMQNCGVDVGRFWLVNACRPTRKNNCVGFSLEKLVS